MNDTDIAKRIVADDLRLVIFHTQHALDFADHAIGNLNAVLMDYNAIIERYAQVHGDAGHLVQLAPAALLQEIRASIVRTQAELGAVGALAGDGRGGSPRPLV